MKNVNRDLGGESGDDTGFFLCVAPYAVGSPPITIYSACCVPDSGGLQTPMLFATIESIRHFIVTMKPHSVFVPQGSCLEAKFGDCYVGVPKVEHVEHVGRTLH